MKKAAKKRALQNGFILQRALFSIQLDVCKYTARKTGTDS